jgi:hypothetical protein
MQLENLARRFRKKRVCQRYFGAGNLVGGKNSLHYHGYRSAVLSLIHPCSLGEPRECIRVLRTGLVPVNHVGAGRSRSGSHELTGRTGTGLLPTLLRFNRAT